MRTTLICTACGKALEEGSQGCPACGQGAGTMSLPEARGAVPIAAPVSSSGPRDQPELFSTGDLVNARFRVERLLGRGGMGAVYLVRDVNLAGRACAMKELMIAAGTDQERQAALRRFASEAETLAALSHPGVPQVYDRFTANGRYYMVMEFSAGVDLGRLMRLFLQEHGLSLPEPEIVRWTFQLCDILEYLHGRTPPVIHRDLKPDNLILVQGGQIRLVDFGIAKATTRGHGTVIGTAGYAPPEQYQGRADPRSDLYALGASLHHLITGSDPRERHPFDFPPVGQLQPGVNPVLQHVVGRLLSLNPADRPPYVQMVREELSNAYPHVDPQRSQGQDVRIAAIVERELSGKFGSDFALGPGEDCVDAGENVYTPVARACPVCGLSVRPGKRFCTQCGVKLAGTVAQLSVSRSAQPPLTFRLPALYWERRRLERVLLADESGESEIAFLVGILAGRGAKYAYLTRGIVRAGECEAVAEVYRVEGQGGGQRFVAVPATGQPQAAEEATELWRRWISTPARVE